MRLFPKLGALLISWTFLLSNGSFAAPMPGGHVADEASLDAAVGAKLDQAEGDREAIRALLARPAVAKLAAGAGLNLERAKGAVDTISGAELTSIARQARTLDADLAGGNTIVITSTAIIIGLLVVVILLLA